mmetsp:Transcript_33317/g.77917  ORF Transcript_33317/g.77917 Transcript_33317/m.77917 type:complete len:464 (-) Transcript_33317:271-1662(-)
MRDRVRWARGLHEKRANPLSYMYSYAPPWGLMVWTWCDGFSSLSPDSKKVKPFGRISPGSLWLSQARAHLRAPLDVLVRPREQLTKPAASACSSCHLLVLALSRQVASAIWGLAGLWKRVNAASLLRALNRHSRAPEAASLPSHRASRHFSLRWPIRSAPAITRCASPPHTWSSHGSVPSASCAALRRSAWRWRAQNLILIFEDSETFLPALLVVFCLRRTKPAAVSAALLSRTIGGAGSPSDSSSESSIPVAALRFFFFFFFSSALDSISGRFCRKGSKLARRSLLLSCFGAPSSSSSPCASALAPTPLLPGSAATNCSKLACSSLAAGAAATAVCEPLLACGGPTITVLCSSPEKSGASAASAESATAAAEWGAAGRTSNVEQSPNRTRPPGGSKVGAFGGSRFQPLPWSTYVPLVEPRSMMCTDAAPSAAGAPCRRAAWRRDTESWGTIRSASCRFRPST